MGRQPFMVGALALVMIGVLAACLPWLWWRALVGAGTALLAGVLLIGGQVLARRTAVDRVTKELPRILGDTSTSWTITASNGSGFWLATGLLAVLAGSWLTILVRESLKRPVGSWPSDSGGLDEPIGSQPP